jgi:SAM-dependent methyltransferase
MPQYSGAPFNFKRAVVDHMFGVRKLAWPLLDAGDYVFRALAGKRQYPPLSARQKVGGSLWASLGQFDAVGRDSVRLLREVTGLQPSHTLLDIGCGCGRTAIPALEYLQPPARYYGGDVDLEMVRWCQGNIPPRHPNATFFHIDVFNSFYNPGLTKRATEYIFPLADASVDRIILISVFTHMMADEVEHYLAEMRRLLAPGGRALISLFLLTPERLQGPARPVVERKFPFAKGRHRLASEKYPELDIAFDESLVMEIVERVGLRLQQPILWGQWTGEPGGFSGHDFLVVEKKPD